MQDVFQVLDRMVGNDINVLIQGETGTGKELVAQALHFQGPRREANFIPVNCGAIPKDLIESQLFGYKRGSFTGAERDHAGLVEEADGGTLFLDEIAELPLSAQAKLLRMIDQREVTRLGESTPRRVDVRIVSATHRDLPTMVQQGEFREDLLYRVKVVTVHLPPLRERGEDVIHLADAFLERTRDRLQRPALRFSTEAYQFLERHTWPGNVRELLNAVERAAALAPADMITPRDLFPEWKSIPARVSEPISGTLKEILLKSEENAIRSALAEADENVSLAARRLGVSRQHLHTRIRRLGIRNT